MHFQDQNTRLMQLKEELQQTMRTLVKIFPDMGVVLLVFENTSPEGSRTSYISNCETQSALNCMKEALARLEGRLIAPTTDPMQ